jgi:malate dehydrogenase (oxaloacetate-decarboxylating)
MADRPVVFALSNPTPEIMPDDAKAAGAAVIATGRSDFPNQINNVLVFPGLFRGLLDSGAPKVTDAIKLRAADALAALIPQPTAELIIPFALDPAVVPAVAGAVARAHSEAPST